MNDPAPSPHPPTKSEIESALVVEIRAQMADPNITPEWYETLKAKLFDSVAGLTPNELSTMADEFEVLR